MNDMKVGLVLSGGGAKGAYHVGVAKALAEMGAQVDAVSGASIGALNGAILACSPSLSEGATRLGKIWAFLGQSSPLEVNRSTYAKLLVAAGLGLTPVGKLVGAAAQILAAKSAEETGLLSDDPLHALLNQFLDENSLFHGLPLYVSVYQHPGGVEALLACGAAELGLNETPASEFLHVQSLHPTQIRDAILASAAIPILFEAKTVNGKTYSDGGQGGWMKSQGNTPITPLLDAGCNMVIVTHLSDGSLWSRSDFPNATILEIRPINNISRPGIVPNILQFRPEHIDYWVDQGYEDAIRCVGRVMRATQSRNALRSSENALTKSTASHEVLGNAMKDALDRLR